MNTCLYDIVRILLQLFFRMATNWQVAGRKYVPSYGKFVLVANHLSVADPPLIGASFNRRMAFLAKQELFTGRFTGWFLRKLGAIPVTRGRMSREILRSTERLLEKGEVLAVFPEGARSSDGQLGPAFAGAALIALRNQAPVLPVAISGTRDIHGFGWIRHRPKLKVNIGPSFMLYEGRPKTIDSQLLKQSTVLIMERIAALMEEKSFTEEQRYISY